MTPEQYQKITDTFLKLCELPDEQRQESLDKLNSEDAQLFKSVDAMLRLDNEQDGRFRSSIEDSVVSEAGDVTGHVLLSGMDRSSGNSSDSDDDNNDDRYQLTRLHATGGMGRVWLARDQAMGRNVALKELREETPNSIGVWNRFLNEAKVTGQLEHPGIVPVYEVDSKDSARPFYTMRFVKGQTLFEAAQAFTESRTSGNHDALKLRILTTALVGVANAIAYAHSRGVLHRDLKGQNVVLGDYGEVIVLDWGLAFIVGTEEQDDDQLPVSGSGVSDQTSAGQVIGTPSYMAPEQASGRNEDMNAQTDIFGLGVVLYEILTGKAPFQADTTAESLELAQACQAPSPRTFWPAAPPALEAICQKAMSKNQADRFQTATEFADELRRWQADERVMAYPESWLTTANRWVRRHQTLSAAMAALVLAAVVGLTVITFVVSTEQKKTAEARSRAETNLAKAREAVQRMLTEVGDDRLKDIPQMEKLREKLLQEALEFNKSFLETSNDPEVRKEAGLAYGNLARINLMLDQTQDAVTDWKNGIQVLTELHEAIPNNKTYAIELAESLLSFASTLQKLEQTEEAESRSRKALTILDQLSTAPSNSGSDTVADSDRILVLIAGCHHAIGLAKDQTGASDQAEAAFQQSIDTYNRISKNGRTTPEVQHAIAKLRQSFGRLLSRTKRTDDARLQFESMLNLGSELQNENSNSRQALELVGAAHVWLATEDRKVGNRESSRSHITQALRIHEQLARNFPHIPAYQYSVASTCGSLAISYAEAGEFADAERFFQRNAEESKQLSETYPEVPDYRYRAASSIRVTGVFLFNTRRIDEAIPKLLDAIERFETLTADFPENPEYPKAMAITMHPLARCYQQLGKPQQARDPVERSIAIYEQLVTNQADVIKIRHKLAQDYRLLGELLHELKDDATAEEYLRKALAAHRTTATEVPQIGEHRRWVAIALDKLAEFLLQKTQVTEALSCVDESLSIRRQLIVEQPSWFNVQAEIPHSLRLKGRTHEALQQTQAAKKAFENGASFGINLLEQFPENSNIREDVAGSYESLARVFDNAEGRLQNSEAITKLAMATDVRRESVKLFPNEQRSRDGLRDNLMDTADLHLRNDDHEAALAALNELLSLPPSDEWQTHFESAELLTRCAIATDEAKTVDQTIATMAISELVLAIEAGMPAAADAIEAETFQTLITLDAWKQIVEAMAID